MNQPIKNSGKLRQVFENPDEMGFMPRADLFMTALEGFHLADRDADVAEALTRVAAVENPSELNAFLGRPYPRKT